VGRSEAVGKPVALLLLARHATVTVAHSRTRELAAETARAEVLVVAAGVPGLVTAEHVAPGATVIDVGTNAVPDGEGERLVGDVAFDEVAERAGAITPVPGGVGPVTTAIVLQSAVALAEARLGVGPGPGFGPAG
jgi:methylenetetrahydrofolate dehydrogenase (NADP+)/methenyltetrahydrofolate cyclohydrolase